MGRLRIGARVFLAGGVALLAGCAGTTRIGDGVTPATLAQSSTAVVVMRVGTASVACRNVALLLGVRSGEGFRRAKTVHVVGVRSITEPAVVEAELAPGEYHIIGYSCATEKGSATIADQADAQLFRTSYASFTLNAGEMINVGYFHFDVSRRGANAISRQLLIKVEVTDWPLAELERYKARRPQVYAQMTTRLMTVTDRGPRAPTGDECTRLKALRKDGKVANLPPSCA